MCKDFRDKYLIKEVTELAKSEAYVLLGAFIGAIIIELCLFIYRILRQ